MAEGNAVHQGQILHLIVCLRHPDLVSKPADQQRILREMFRSLTGQSDNRFVCHLVVNPSQILPPLPDFARRIEIDLPPNEAYRNAKSEQEAYEAIQQDKGLRVFSVLRQLEKSDLVMAIDDDDFLHRDLVHFILTESERDGSPSAWVVDKGYGWRAGSDEVFKIDRFHRLCGTSLIVRADRYRAVQAGHKSTNDLVFDEIKELGSHRLLVDSDVRNGRTFGRVPFRGVIYRMGHSNSAVLGIYRSLHGRSWFPPAINQIAWSLVRKERALRRLITSRLLPDLLRPPIQKRRQTTSVAIVAQDFFGPQ